MKKQKLQQFAKFAAISIIGAFPVLGLSEISAQQPSLMPPIVQGTPSSARPDVDYSYSSGMSKPLAPARMAENSGIVPPIISGNPIGVGVAAGTSQSNPANGLLAPIGSGIKQVAGRVEPALVGRAFSPAKMPVLAQEISQPGIGVPAIQIPSPMSIAPTSPRNMSVLPGAGMDASMQAAPVISGSLVSPGMPQSIMDSGSMTVAPGYFEAGPVVDAIPMESVVAGCGSCGDSSCDTCGPNGSYNPNQINCDYGTYGSVSAARRYAYLEMLYLTREDGNITNSNFNPLGEFDFNPGWRITLGQRPDMTQGREISYFGTAGIEASQTTNNAENRLNALFVTGGGLISDDLSAFNGASQHIQFKETSVHSIELNRVRWGWDVLKSFVGWRYVYMDDKYQLDSTAPNRDIFGNVAPGFETGQYRIDTINHMLGAHIGAELFYDIGYRFSLSGLSKFGAYANINKVDNFLQNGGTTLLDTEDNNANISTTYELQLMAHYQIRQTARLRFGYNGMFLGNVATVADNFSPFVSPFTGFSGSDDDDAFVHGFSLGLEIYR
ncbi:BBP7 family outer membrane beta-barrel protein [Mariniblastus fucicola]|uniref:Uncharacterized protein n=1 Tax=Mariniblastus fucicola TaxID=980251 RepID=A0A5B9PD98_9BACT|nr:BBP7 family outer membrane beta-barrel protein [Mariniblastus fucicola]QEG23070.1 hypothetical protein MFFC18_29620 [Mariniblastus fucicola]